MKIEVIKNKTQHEEYLAEIRKLILIDPVKDSEKGKLLELLTVLVENYEKENFPIDKPNPIEAIRFRMDQENLKQKDLIPYIGSASKVSEILSGTRTLTLQMIRNLSSGLGIPADVLMQKNDTDLFEDLKIDPREIPIREMVKWGWITASQKDVRKKTNQLIQEFFSPFENRGYFPLFCRRTINTRTKHKVNQGAILAWAARILMKADEEHFINDYKPEIIDKSFLIEVAQLSRKKDGPINAKKFLAENGISLIVERHLPGTKLDGGSMLTFDKRPVIGLTLRQDRIDNFWFTLMHELAHICLHLIKEDEVFIDDIDCDYGEDPREMEADRFAREALIPRSIWTRSDAFRKRTRNSIIDFADKLKIHPAIIAGRIRFETRDYSILDDLIGRGEVRQVFSDVNWD